MQHASVSSESLAETAEILRLTEELNAGEQNLSTLQSELTACKEETLRLRSKAASVALSFEGLKDELQSLLQSEVDIRSSAHPSSPTSEVENGDKPSADPTHDHATLCALTGQLEATKRLVEKAVHERDDLLRKMSEDGSIHIYSYSPSDVSALKFFQKLLKVEEDLAPDTTEMDLIQKLNALSTSGSSFRDDHARIWRDSTLPNVALLTWKKTDTGERVPDSVTCGVVSERLFAGITAYTSTNADGEVGEHCYLSSCDIAKEVTDQEFEAVKGAYSTLLLKDNSMAPHDIKLIAPKQALERVVQLIRSAANHTMILSPSAPSTPTSLNKPRDDKLLSSPDHGEIGSTGSTSSATATRRKRPGPRLSDPSHVLAPEHFQFLLHECIPVRFQESDLQLKYSTNNDGMSVHTLYERCNGVSPTVVAVRDSKGRVFGCYASRPWEPTAPRYYGTGECFVFSCKPRLAVYKWNRQNHFFQFSHHNILAMGGGGGTHYALWVDEDLVRGSTCTCKTFDSPPLACKSGDEEVDRIDFDITVLEVWTVVPRSSHLGGAGNTG